MAGQGPSRRELLEAMAIAAAASTFSGFSKWGFAHAQSSTHHEHAPSATVKIHPAYTPQFFTQDEYETVDHLSNLILPPSTSGTKRIPGAHDVGVAEFIDFMVFSQPAAQEPFRGGLKWLDGTAKPASSFLTLSTDQQHAILDRLAYTKQQRADEKAGQQFFSLMRRFTVMGYYTTREGLESLDFPGLTFYATSPGCPHHENPEHVGL